MNRSHYYEYCVERLSTLALSIEIHGKLNVLNLHIHCENFYVGLLNALYSYKLVNMNATVQNAAAIDLIDHEKKILVQVSATATKAKIDSALNKNLSAHKGSIFHFISICKDASDLRTKVYVNPHKLKFTPKSDIHDVVSISNSILALEIARQKFVYELIKAEIGAKVDDVRMPSNIAKIISIVSKEDLSDIGTDFSIDEFAIAAKIAFNGLSTAKATIDDQKIYHGRISKVYAEFDKEGQNKSLSVLHSIRKMYLTNKKVYAGDDLFFVIVDDVVKKVRGSAHLVEIPSEELEMCASILVVDAFIRCKVFEPPKVIHAAA